MIKNGKIYDDISDADLLMIYKDCTFNHNIRCKKCPLNKDSRAECQLLELMADRFESLIMKNSEYISLLVRALDELSTAKSCEICSNVDQCDSQAPYESPKWKMWRTCGEIEKKNYRWRGDKE